MATITGSTSRLDTDLFAAKPCKKAIVATNEDANEVVTLKRKTPFRRVFESPRLRKSFEGFLDNVFMQLDKEKFYALMDEVMKDKTLSDAQIYEKVYARIDEARPSGLKKIYQQLKSLKTLRGVMLEQANYVIGQLKSVYPHKIKVSGLMEIGYPGRHLWAARKLFHVTGPVYAMEDTEKLSDIAQHGIIKPYGKMIHLGDYEGISEEVKNGSLDLVYCFTGLHHGKPDAIENFVQDLFLKIRPGGHFVLRDHDCKKHFEDGKRTGLGSLAKVVHKVFNLGTGVSPKENEKEIHNFQPMAYWKDLLERNGFRCITEGEGLVQEGDPSMNTLVAFERMPTSGNADEELIAAKRIVNNDPNYVRPISSSAMSANEWHIVDVAKEYKNFMTDWSKGEKTFDEFPFWSQMGVLWRLFIDSCQAVRKNHGTKELLSNVDTYMNGSFAVMLTIDMLFKAILWAPVRLFTPRSAKQSARGVEALANYAKNYGDFLDVQYFHEYRYLGEIKNFWAAVWNDKGFNNTLLNLYIATTMSIGLAVKGIFCGMINRGYGDVGDPHFDIIVRGENIPKNDKVEIKAAYGKTQVLSIPRYKPATEYLIELAKAGVTVVEMSGQKEIYIKTIGQPYDEEIRGCQKAFEKPILGDERKYVTYKVELEELGSVLKAFEGKGLEVHYIHDY